MLLCIWDNGFRDRKTTPDQEHPIDATTQDATTQFPRRHPHRLRRPPPGGNNAGLILPATLAQHLGLPQLVQQRLDLGNAPGRANTGDKIVTLVASALAGGDCIDDADVLRTGRTAGALGCVVKAPSTLGTFLRSFRWGHVRQLDRVSRELLARAWAAWGRTRRRAVDHRPGLHHLRDLPTNQRCHAAIGAPGGAYVVRSPASDIGTSW